MIGYPRVENPGVIERPVDGWHDTGDIVTIDAQGFITIKGRLKRFAKVGGEMISLAAVEPRRRTVAGSDIRRDHHSDLRKGERLILVTTHKAPSRSEFIAFVHSKGASEMLIPAEFIVLDKLSLLGSGKVDNLAVTKLVRERFKLEGAACARRVPHTACHERRFIPVLADPFEPSFRESSNARLPGIHRFLWVNMDSGLAAPRRPGMTDRCHPDCPSRLRLARGRRKQPFEIG